ncbi:MAG TPA: hypothetical protein VHL59_13440, partial [Thermoanaerobaculia bacterium]|nr:hypothetical protein [Thermoanaerobaculia bacterium]
IDWNAVASRIGTALRSGGSGIATAGLRGGDLDALVDAIGQQGKVRMIAAPRTLAMNNEPAMMRAGLNEVSFGDTASGKAVTVAEGLTLTVTPQIAADGLIVLNVAPAWAEKTGERRSREEGALPVLRVTEADTLVRVQDGEAVVISGTLSERTEARTSTGLSGLFGAQDRRTVHTELVVLLSASVVVPAAARTEGWQ